MLWYTFQLVEATLLRMTPAFLLIRLRRPRPPFPSHLRQPGTVLGLAVGLGLDTAEGHGAPPDGSSLIGSLVGLHAPAGMRARAAALSDRWRLGV